MNFGVQQRSMWSDPAREGGGTFSIDASRPTAIASKLGSHRDWRWMLIFYTTKKLYASLLAKAVS